MKVFFYKTSSTLGVNRFHRRPKLCSTESASQHYPIFSTTALFILWNLQVQNSDLCLLQFAHQLKLRAELTAELFTVTLWFVSKTCEKAALFGIF